ncbi:MAG: pyruvate kinase [Chloroflexota bacterium]|jgi:pyruvate kinase
MSPTPSVRTSRRTKLVATIGPASIEHVEQLIAAGLDIARINFSHGTDEDHLRAAEVVRTAAAAAGRTVGILADLPGPKLRLAQLHAEPVELKTGTTVTLTGPDVPPSDASLPLGDEAVPALLELGDRVLLADGAAELRVTGSRNAAAICEVVRGGPVRSRQGASVPAERMAADALGRADEAVIPHLLAVAPDFAGQSFVRSANDVRLLRSRIPEDIGIVAKIETRPALEQIEDILEVADGIMVARGDLGVELPYAQVPLAQKDLVRAALVAGKPSIVATQMLESMIKAPRPTRAEASDVANAIMDGADAVMLSGETAVGDFPLESLEAMANIAERTDHYKRPTRPPAGTPSFGPDVDARALAVAAVSMADTDPDVVAMACYTHSGRTPRRLSSLRPGVPVAAFTPTEAIARALTLRRGVYPVVMQVEPEDPVTISEAVVRALRERWGEFGLGEDDAVAFVQTSVRGGPNQLELLRI